MMGHYESEGNIWEEGDIPECSYCYRKADRHDIYETTVSGIFCCDNFSCAIEHITNEGSLIELREDD